MKKALAMLVLCLLFVGCTAIHNNTDLIFTEPAATDTQEELVSSPPLSLHFYDLSDCLTFLSTAERSDKEFDAFLSSHSTYRMNDIDSKDDVTAVRTRMHAIPFPIIEEVYCSQFMTYMREAKTQIWLFARESDARITVTVNETEGSGKNRSVIDGYPIEHLEARSTNEADALYYVGLVRASGPDPYYLYFADVEGKAVVIRCFDTTREKADEAISTLRFVDILESGEDAYFTP